PRCGLGLVEVTTPQIDDELVAMHHGDRRADITVRLEVRRECVLDRSEARLAIATDLNNVAHDRRVASFHGPASARGSLGSPSTRSPMMFRCTWDVPAYIVPGRAPRKVRTAAADVMSAPANAWIDDPPVSPVGVIASAPRMSR